MAQNPGNADAADAAQDLALAVCEGRVAANYDPVKGTHHRFAFAAVLNFQMTRRRGGVRYARAVRRSARAKGHKAESTDGRGLLAAANEEWAARVAAALCRLTPAERAEVERRVFGRTPQAALPTAAGQRFRYWASARRKLAGWLAPLEGEYFGD